MSRNLYIAYVTTWVIHSIYFTFLWRRYSRLKREQAALRK